MKDQLEQEYEIYVANCVSLGWPVLDFEDWTDVISSEDKLDALVDSLLEACR